MTITKDQTATFTALKAGDVDIAARSVPPELLATFGSSPDLRVVSTTPLTAVLVRLNYARAPFDQPRFRQAFSYAIDRDAMVSTILLGHGRPGTVGYPHPDSPWTSPDLTTPYDPAKATSLLDGLGYLDTNGDGIRETPAGPIQLVVQVASTEPARVRAAQLLVDQMHAVGIGLTVRTADPGAIRSLTTSRDFDLFVDQGFAHELADPDQFIESNRSGLDWSQKLAYPEWDALVAQWKAADTLQARTAIAYQCQILFNSQPTAVPLWYPEEDWAFRPAAYDGWAESRGYGIVNKWSLLPLDARAGRIVQNFG